MPQLGRRIRQSGRRRRNLGHRRAPVRAAGEFIIAPASAFALKEAFLGIEAAGFALSFAATGSEGLPRRAPWGTGIRFSLHRLPFRTLRARSQVIARSR